MEESIYNEFKKTAEKMPENSAIFWKEDGIWKKNNYIELLKKIDNCSINLFSFGLRFEERAAIFSENCPEWLICDLAFNKLGVISVPIHFTSNLNTLEFILTNSGAKFLIISENLYEKHFKKSKLNLQFLEKIIIIGKDVDYKDKKIINFSKLTKENSSIIIEPKIDQETIASIIYTSGTTGMPKGVMLTNENFLENVKEGCTAVKIQKSDKFLSFLPLSHVFERTVGSYAPMLNGASIAYSESVKKLPKNITETNPTIIVGVPKIFERIYEKIFSEIFKKGNLSKKIFFWSLKQNEKQKKWNYKIANQLIYKKIRKIFGNNLRFAISGAASLNPKIFIFFQKMGVKIVEGYGLTETSPIITTNRLDSFRAGTVGIPLSGVKVKINPDKEILVKGKNVMRGYWQNEEATKEAFDNEGWFKTGDLGFLDKENFLTIIGRKKDIIVTTNGKNIAPEKIEGVINLSPFISQSLVVGHKKPYLIALVIPDYEALKNEKNIDVTEDVLAEKIIQNEINKINKDLEKQEQIKKIKIIKIPFSIEADELTPTLKIRRKYIEAKYLKEIEGLY